MLQAVGNWDGQKPVFRGCAGVTFAHGNTCKREMQIVEVTPGRPKVILIIVIKEVNKELSTTSYADRIQNLNV